MSITRVLIGLMASSLLLIAGSLALAATGQPDTPFFATSNGAIDGYDPVAYFEQGSALRGRAEVSAEWRGVTWHFISDDHRQKFRSDPERYAPAYGGFCALGTAHGGLVPSNGEAFTIIDGKLYLNQGNAVRETWLYAPDRMIARADSLWAGRNETLAPTPPAAPQPALDAGFALAGLDPVSYFEDTGVLAGNSNITAEWSGMRWRFASEAHRAAFLEGPSDYLPQYGGNSTLTVAHGLAISASPLSYVVHKGKLYFDFSPRVIETLSYEIDKVIERADRNWSKLSTKP